MYHYCRPLKLPAGKFIMSELMIRKIRKSIEKFDLDLHGTSVLTEAATGNFVVTSVIAALAGADVWAYTKATRYGTIDEVTRQTLDLASQAGVDGKIKIIDSLDEVPWAKINIVTNCGHLRPIDSAFIARLSSHCVIPLMWEPWEYRAEELDLEACCSKGIKVYGTDESDPRLLTMEYIGFVVLYILFQHSLSPYSARALLVGCPKFIEPIRRVLHENHYSIHSVTDYESEMIPDLDSFDVIVLAEHERDKLLIDDRGWLLERHRINSETLVVHVCGNVHFPNSKVNFFPQFVRPFGYMSLTPDYVDPMAVVDLHTAGLIVAKGMLEANKKGLSPEGYKQFMERNYPSLAFDNKRYW